MTSWLIVFLGAGIGGALRHGMNALVTRLVTSDFPFGILAINVLGSMAMGLLAGWFAFRGEASYAVRLFLTTGVLGGFTTFSAFSLDAALLVERGQLGQAVTYVAASVGLSIAGLMGAMWLLQAR